MTWLGSLNEGEIKEKILYKQQSCDRMQRRWERNVTVWRRGMWKCLRNLQGSLENGNCLIVSRALCDRIFCLLSYAQQKRWELHSFSIKPPSFPPVIPLGKSTFSPSEGSRFVWANQKLPWPINYFCSVPPNPLNVRLVGGTSQQELF